MAAPPTVFAQILRLVPRAEFEKLAREHGGHKRVRSCSCWAQLASLLSAQRSRQTSLRDLVLPLETKRPFLCHTLGTSDSAHTSYSWMPAWRARA